MSSLPNLTPSSPGVPEILKIVNAIYNRQEAQAFRDPVDWEGLGLFDYLEIIKTPMDLGTIKKKIDKEEYATLEVYLLVMPNLQLI